MSCEHCTDPDGQPCMPSYGVAPHECFYKIPGAKLGESRLLPRDQWPDNFVEDPDDPGHGTYWCAHCGEGKPESRSAATTPSPASTDRQAMSQTEMLDLCAKNPALASGLPLAAPATGGELDSRLEALAQANAQLAAVRASREDQMRRLGLAGGELNVEAERLTLPESEGVLSYMSDDGYRCNVSGYKAETVRAIQRAAFDAGLKARSAAQGSALPPEAVSGECNAALRAAPASQHDTLVGQLAHALRNANLLLGETFISTGRAMSDRAANVSRQIERALADADEQSQLAGSARQGGEQTKEQDNG